MNLHKSVKQADFDGQLFPKLDTFVEYDDDMFPHDIGYKTDSGVELRIDENHNVFIQNGEGESLRLSPDEFVSLRHTILLSIVATDMALKRYCQ